MDKYADIRAALDAATPGPWEWSTEICERGPAGKGNTIRVSLSAPRNSHAHARTAVLTPNWNTSEGDVWQAWISCNEANAAYIAACHPEAVRALLAERDALVHDNAEYVGAASALATENQQLREALTKVRQVIAADRQALLDTHGNGTEIPGTDELGSLALYDYDGALHAIDAALAQEES